MASEAETLLDEYGPLVRGIARSACFSSATIDLADLCQVGEIAVLEAVRKYDPSSGANIRSYVSRLVRQAVYHEAGRFLGVFTVDHRVTSLAAKANRLHADEYTDEEIACTMNEQSKDRSFDAEHVRDLRLVYGRRQHLTVSEDDAFEESDVDERTIQKLLEGVIQNESDRVILDQRILGSGSVLDVSRRLLIPPRRVYDLESDLKRRIKQAIRDMGE